MSENYPPGVSGLPDDKLVEEDYIFEVHGELRVKAYSEEDAKVQLEENLRDILASAPRWGDLEIK